MSAEGQTIREALDTLLLLLVDEHRTSDEHEVEIREEYAPAFEALAALEVRLAANETILLRHQLCEGKILRAEARLVEAERALRGLMAALVVDEDGELLVGGIDTWGPAWTTALAALPSESETPTTKGTQ